MLYGVFACGALEHRCQGFVLFVQLLQHQAQLLSVFRHKVGLSFGEQALAFTYVVDFLCHQFSHLGSAACREDICIEQRLGVDKFLPFAGHERLWLGGGGRQSIDGLQNTVIANHHVGGIALGIEFYSKAFCCICQCERGEAQREHTVRYIGNLAHILQAQIFFCILRQLSGSVGGLLYQYADAQGCFGKEIYGALSGLSWAVFAYHCLCTY